MLTSHTLKQIIHSLCLVALLFLSGCQSVTIHDIDSSPLLHDDLFVDYRTVEIESVENVFFIGEKAIAFVDERLGHLEDQTSRIEALIAGIFDHTNLNLLYKNDANTIANVTFGNRAANCLSLTIMTYAMADYAGLGVRFQQVNIPELWVRRDGNSLLNRHVNLRLYSKTKNNIILYQAKSFHLDFDSRTQSLRLPVQEISKQRVLALFYNNKGVDALLQNNYSKAYAYIRSSLTTDSTLIDAWTNLGILYRRMGRLEYAEHSYQQALAIDKNDATTLENLAYLYSLTERQQQAKRIKKKIKEQRKQNPFYHFMLGEVEFERQNWQQAIRHFKKAIRLNKRQAQFYLLIAKSYHKIGDIDRSEYYMAESKKYAKTL